MGSPGLFKQLDFERYPANFALTEKHYFGSAVSLYTLKC